MNTFKWNMEDKEYDILNEKGEYISYLSVHEAESDLNDKTKIIARKNNTIADLEKQVERWKKKAMAPLFSDIADFLNEDPEHMHMIKALEPESFNIIREWINNG